LRDLITMLDDLKHRGVNFRSLSEEVDTATPTGTQLGRSLPPLTKVQPGPFRPFARRGHPIINRIFIDLRGLICAV
jgi:hypothetical protein